jgi:predicted anti-sigma-YlaC factor YlaD
MSKKSSYNAVTSDLHSSGIFGLVGIMLGAALLSSILFGIAPLLTILAGIFMAFVFVSKFFGIE